MRQLDAKHHDVSVSLLPEEERYQLLKLAYEHFGREIMVVHLSYRANFDPFPKLGDKATTVDSQNKFEEVTARFDS